MASSWLVSLVFLGAQTRHYDEMKSCKPKAVKLFVRWRLAILTLILLLLLFLTNIDCVYGYMEVYGLMNYHWSEFRSLNQFGVAE